VPCEQIEAGNSPWEICSFAMDAEDVGASDQRIPVVSRASSEEMVTWMDDVV